MGRKFLRNMIAGVSLAILFGAAVANVSLKDSHPDEYYVKPGDTLWDISKVFLNKPWLWPELWHGNESIENPHLIYPGDKIILRYVDDKPRLMVDDSDSGVIKLSPSIRESDLSSPVPVIPLETIESFLRDAWVLDKDEIDRAPYILGGENQRVIFGQGDLAHVRDPETHWKNLFKNYAVFRVGERYVDEKTNEILGYEALRIGQGKVEKKSGDIVSIRIEKSEEELKAGDKVMVSPPRALKSVYYPSAPDVEIEGAIVRLFGRLTSVARHDVVVINRGAREGLKEGHVLETYHRGEVVRDDQRGEIVRLPDTKSGVMVLFRVFDKVSYGLIMESYLPIYKSDIVRSPEQ